MQGAHLSGVPSSPDARKADRAAKEGQPARHIAVLTPWWPSRRSPTAGAFVQQDVAALRAAGYRVSVICVRVPGWVPRRLRDLWFGLIAAARLAFLGDLWIVHAYNVLPAGLIAALWSYTMLGTPAVLVEVTCPFALHTRGRWSAQLVKWTLARLPVRAACGSQLAAEIGGSVLPCVVDTPPPPASSRHFGLRVLYAGRFDQRKGADLLPLIWDQFTVDERAKLELVCMGSGPLERSLRATKGQVLVLPPAASRRQYLAWLEWADLVLVPSREEGMGLVAAEAASLGKLVAATDTGFHRDYDNVLLMEDREPARWAELIRDVQRMPDLKIVKPEAAHRWMRERFGPEIYVQRVRALYQAARAKEGLSVHEEGEGILRRDATYRLGELCWSVGAMVVAWLLLPFVVARAGLERNLLDKDSQSRSVKGGQRAA